MLLGRWKSYIETYHGGNKELKRIENSEPGYISKNFYFSILETFNYNTNDEIIIARENHWKEVLRTREFGYNAN